MKIVRLNVKKPEVTTTKTSTRVISSSSAPSNDWFYFDGNNVHCRYNLVGDLEVSAYGDNSTTDKMQLVINALLNIDVNSSTLDIATALINIKDALAL